MIEIPYTEEIPDYLYDPRSLGSNFRLLGFTPNTLGNLSIQYFDVKNNMSVVALENFFQWELMFSFQEKSGRSIYSPLEYAICNELTAIEILAILCNEWKAIFRQDDLPFDLSLGNLYLEHLEKLRQSRPKPPQAMIDRETFKFFNKKLRETFDPESEDELEITWLENNVRISGSKKDLYIPARTSNLMEGKISISAKPFFKNIPKRNNNETVSFGICKEGYYINRWHMHAKWDGPNFAEYAEYDWELQKRLMRRATMNF